MGSLRGNIDAMDVLGSRILLRPTNPARTRAFYRDVLGLAVYREFGPEDSPSLVFFLSHGFLEVSGRSGGDQAADAGDPTVDGAPADGHPAMALWLQVRDVSAEHHRLRSLGVPVQRAPRREPWGLVEMWLQDPDGVPIVLVEVPDDHPLRRDRR